MTKIELLRQYISDLKMHVPESQGRNNRIAVLEEELEHEQLQNTSSNSDYTKSCDDCIYGVYGCQHKPPCTTGTGKPYTITGR